eukprot:PhF_6_TR2284/c0_g1_i2/m.3971/K03929/pnbA; para-nitrobenzyl esterase
MNLRKIFSFNFLVWELTAICLIIVRKFQDLFFSRSHTVTIHSGTVSGFVRSSSLYYRGIQYAHADPFGPPTLLPESTTKHQRGHRFGHVALQPFSFLQMRPPYTLWGAYHFVKHKYYNKVLGHKHSTYGHSHCQTLNICAPAESTSTSDLPVMVWFHGGAFLYGTANEDMYDSSELVKYGKVVVVTVNYRLGVLGYLYLPDAAPNANNRGLQDQITALQWVQKNIRSFGGNPHNVTVFGESAGAMSCAALLGCESARRQRLFHKVILQSGAANVIQSVEDGTETAEMLAKEIGVDNVGELGKHITSVPYKKLMSAQERVCTRYTTRMVKGQSHKLLALCPVAGVFPLDRNPLDVIRTWKDKAGEEVKLLVGTTDVEYALFSGMDPRQRKRTTEDAVSILNGISTSLSLKPSLMADVITSYEKSPDYIERMPKPQWLNAVMTDFVFRAPSEWIANAHSASVPPGNVFMFRFDRSYRDTRLGAGHGVELGYVFGRASHSPMMYGKRSDTRVFEQRVMDVWSSFAREGCHKEGLLVPWSPVDRKVTVFGAKNTAEVVVVQDPDPLPVLAWSPIMSEMEKKLLR